MTLQNYTIPFASNGYFAPNSPFLYNQPSLYPAIPGRLDQTPYQQTPLPLEQHNNYLRESQTVQRYTKVNSGFSASRSNNGKTSVHAIVDYDDDFDTSNEDYDKDLSNNNNNPNNNYNQLPPALRNSQITPIQGPIFIKNGSVPVVPLFSYPHLNNGSLIQIPIMWAALSLALGYEVRGDIIRGAPCIKRHNQLFCPTAGSSYPIDKIEKFIDDNKALMRRMYGEFETNNLQYDVPPHQNKRTSSSSSSYTPQYQHHKQQHQQGYDGNQYFNERSYSKRQAAPQMAQNKSGRVDTCESKLEVVTPYWAHNSAGKLRAVVNTQHFEQAIHQEVCTKSETQRCTDDCRCEQKYKWHRLLAYDPDNECKGIFMDWFLFPSCCVCRCAPASQSQGGNN